MTPVVRFGAGQAWVRLLGGATSVLVTFLEWIAENIGTYAHAWRYPHQAGAWTPVSLGKFGSWYLMLLLSYALVLAVNGVRAMPPAAGRTRRARYAGGPAGPC